jgi:hypothetical protein
VPEKKKGNEGLPSHQNPGPRVPISRYNRETLLISNGEVHLVEVFYALNRVLSQSFSLLFKHIFHCLNLHKELH